MKTVAIFLVMFQFAPNGLALDGAHRSPELLENLKRKADSENIATDGEGRRISKYRLTDFNPCEMGADMQTRFFGDTGYMIAFRLIRPITDPAELVRKKGEILEPATPGTPDAECGLLSLDKNGHIVGRVRPYAANEKRGPDNKADDPSLVPEDIVKAGGNKMESNPSFNPFRILPLSSTDQTKVVGPTLDA